MKHIGLQSVIIGCYVIKSSGQLALDVVETEVSEFVEIYT